MNSFASLPRCKRLALAWFAFALAAIGLGLAARLGHWPWPARWSAVLLAFGGIGLFCAALAWWSPDMSDAVPTALKRRYYREMAPAMTAYVGVMLVWRRLLDLVSASWLRVLVAILPAMLILLVMRAFVRFVRNSDEMQRRIELESGAVAALLISALYLGAGFLQIAGLIAIPADDAMIWVFPAQCLAYGIARAFIARRYL